MIDPHHIVDHCDFIRAQLFNKVEIARVFIELTKDCLAPTILEVGTWYGGSACMLGRIAKILGGKLICVDKWEECNEIAPGLGDHTYMAFLKHMRLAEVGEVISILRDSSENASLVIEDGSCDLIFIDCDHLYPAISRDIRLWWPKVKLGGYLSGHDSQFYWSEDERQKLIDLDQPCANNIHGGVITALYEAFGDYHSLSAKNHANMWYIRKGFIPLKGGIR